MKKRKMTQTEIEWTRDVKWFVGEGDAIEKMLELPSESIDLIVTDPPYESLEKHRAQGTTTRLKHSKMSSNDWFKIFPNSRFNELLEQSFRVLKPNSHLYIFCDDTTSNVLWDRIAEAPPQYKFRWWKRIVWDKVSIGMGYHWRARYEFIVFLEKGKRKLNELGWPDVIAEKRLPPKNAYPGQKPIGVCEKLILNSTQEGDLVLDPFCGSGTTGVAALSHGRRFTGFDIEPEAITRTRERIHDLCQKTP